MYGQLNESLDSCTELHRGLIEWDANNYCTVEALVKDGKADLFRVVPLISTEPPCFDAITKSVMRDGCEKVGGVWRYRWRIDSLSPEQIAANKSAKEIESREAAKAVRSQTVARIKVTIKSGKTFDGDETSQGRMARGILGLQSAGAPSVTWVLADNTPTQVTAEELGEALALSGAAQSAAWII